MNIITWEKFLADVDELGEMLLEGIAEGDQYDFIHGIPRGGLISAVILSHRLDIELLTSKEGAEAAEARGCTILIVDDLCDTGAALQEWNEWDDLDLAGRHLSVTLYVKEHSKHKPDFYIEDKLPNDEWIVFPWEQMPACGDDETKKHLDKIDTQRP